ncbi:2-dehydropantoate 2-reductase [Rhizodiscina lignyota]|uniref:2-dehydropantoate 2-reductase n=1 Tax=Rhizodiscina lignyota TaxID=1504668 RepID=A0A9P4MCZ0_9PEZI|nr:2-dehydropantoate 2-reductase [Rhizodiscina lignyota]
MVNTFIFGAGGVGCVYGWILSKAGARVTAACRTNYEAVKRNGIRIRSTKWGKQQYNPITVRTAAEARSHGPFDYILVCSKAFPGTAGLIKDAVSENTAIVLAQNGIGIEDEYAKLYPDNTIVSGIVYLPVTQVEPGVAVHTTFLEQFEIGTFPANASASAKAQCQRLSDLWKAAGAKAPVFDDVQVARWNKLALNATLNPITALTLCDDANFIRSSPGALDMAKDVMREVGRIASAAGYPIITEKVIEEHMQRHVDRLVTGGKEPSMLTDIRHNRPIEVEAILGNAVRIAQGLKVETPYLRLLYMLAKGRNYAVAQVDGWKPIATVEE